MSKFELIDHFLFDSQQKNEAAQQCCVKPVNVALGQIISVDSMVS